MEHLNTVLRVTDLPESMRAVSRWRALVDLGSTWLAILAIAAGVAFYGHVWAWVLGGVVIGVLQNRLMVLWHHSIHYNMHPSRRVNDAVGRWLLIAPVGQPWGLMRRAHMLHHRALGETRDQDRWYYDLDLHGRRQPRVFLGWLLVNCLGGLLYPQIRKVLTGKRDEFSDPGTEYSRRDRYDMLAVIVCQAVLFLVFFGVTGFWWGYFAWWVVPVVTLGGGLNCLRTTLEHADHAEPAQRRFSYRSNWLERLIIAPANMNYHWEHHVLMTVPYYRMAALRQLMLEREYYGAGRLLGSYLARIRELAGGLRQTG